MAHLEGGEKQGKVTAKHDQRNANITSIKSCLWLFVLFDEVNQSDSEGGGGWIRQFQG